MGYLKIPKQALARVDLGWGDSIHALTAAINATPKRNNKASGGTVGRIT